MGTKKVTREAVVRSSLPDIRTIGTSDLIDALKLGIADFNKKPTHYVFLCITYPILMIIIARIYAGYEVLPMVFPVIAGSTLLGPFAACGMYELSRRMEQGLDSHWTHCFGVFRSPAIFGILVMGVSLGIIFIAWLFAAQALYAVYFAGAIPDSISSFFSQMLTTSTGWMLVIVGCGIGFIFAALVLTISVVSFPLLLDKHVDPMTAALTSVKAVAANPKAMFLWGLIVAGLLFLGAVPIFVGLSVVMPVLGHATWHLYRKVVVS